MAGDEEVEASVDLKPDLMERLELLETGELDVAAARTLVREALAGTDDEMQEEVYAALRGWTGRALRATLPADDFRKWHALVGAASARMGAGAQWSIRVEVLAELLYERAGMAESRAPEKVARRLHAPEILALLAAQPARALSRADIGRELALGQANLTRVCNLLADGGLVRRRADGRTVSFEITASGLAHARPPAAGIEAIAADLGGTWHVGSGAEFRPEGGVPVGDWAEGLQGWGACEPANDDFEYAMAA